jgi:hypothetical protein
MRKDDSTEPTPTIEPLTSELPRFFNRLLDGWIGFKQRLPLEAWKLCLARNLSQAK